MKRFIITLLLLTAAALTAGSLHVRAHPDSIGAYMLFSIGIRVFEPSYTERQPGITLIGDFVSYSAVSEIETILKAAGISWTRSPDTAPDPRRPPFAEHQIVIAVYTHLGCQGELHLDFLNDRLESVLFYPIDFDKYTKAVETMEGKALQRPSAMENQIWIEAGRRKIAVGTELMDKKRRFVGWFDPRFEKEVNAWIMRYS
jgi:hypothetical protein